ncbi:MAG: CdvA-like protein [Candidatus Hodarchaeota archaeon]
MSESTSTLFSYLGKPVKDEYGHTVGTMASFLVTPGGMINGVFVEHGDGRIQRYSRDQIRTESDYAVLFSPLKMKAQTFCDQIPLLWRKTQAIRDLNEKQKIPENMYDDLYSSFEGALNQLKTEAKSVISETENELGECMKRIKELNSALISLEIEREIGQIDEESYHTAVEMIREGLKRLNAERGDFEELRQKLSNILIGEPKEPVQEPVEETEPEETVPEETMEQLDTSLPEPPESTGENPVVVYVKNADNHNP